MTPERHAQIGEIYQAALEREPLERNSFLAQACGGDEALRQEITSLLDYEARGERLIDRPALEAATQAIAEDQIRDAAASPAPTLIGQSVGHFRILAQLGLARAAALVGDAAQSRKAYEKFFAAWPEADTGLPLMIEAKRAYKQK